MTTEQRVPVVDFGPCSLDGGEGVDPSSPETQSLAEEITKALRSIGFVYIINHGIPQKLIDDGNKCALSFFGLPEEVKQKYARPEAGSNHGWVVLEREKLNPERPADYKEAYNATSLKKELWPVEHVPGFHGNHVELMMSCREISHRFLQLMGVGLKMKNYKLFSEAHEYDSATNVSTIRYLSYPAVPADKASTPGLIRCGEHSDYGSITLLFQDEAGGLEVCTRNGVYIPAPPLDGSIVINIGDLMQQWTSDDLLASKHRVVMPKDEAGRRQARQSLAFFAHPDNDCLIECIDGSNKYAPITSGDYIKMRFAVTY